MSPFHPHEEFATVVDGLEPVRLSRPGGPPAIELAGALRRAGGRREAGESVENSASGDAVWHLPGGPFTPRPHVGDLLTDGSGECWTILSVCQATLGTRWKCVCRNLAIVHGLDTRVDLERAVITKSPAGAERFQWQPWRTGLAARIRPAEVRIEAGPHRQHSRPLYRIYLLETVEIEATCRVRGHDGAVYQILGGRRPASLGNLMVLEVERSH